MHVVLYTPTFLYSTKSDCSSFVANLVLSSQQSWPLLLDRIGMLIYNFLHSSVLYSVLCQMLQRFAKYVFS
jgi:hypothetical protein